MLEKITVSSILIISILIIRAVFQKKISAILQYSLWGLVALRLLLPGTIGTSPISIMNTGCWNVVSTMLSEEYSRQDKAYKVQKYQEYLNQKNAEERNSAYETVLSGDGNLGQYKNESSVGDEILREDEADKVEIIELKWQPASTLFGRIREIFMGIWFLGALVCSVVFVKRNLSLYNYLKATGKEIKKVQAGKKWLHVYTAGNRISSPCLFGLHPSIYIPEEKSDITEEALTFILEHELTHYRHKDHIWALVRILCLIMNWFNPLVWMAARLSACDGELACDEGSIRRLGEEQRTAYGEVLLAMIHLSGNRKALFTYGAMMTSEKKFMKKRIENIAAKRKSSLWFMIVTVVLALFCAGCTLTGKVDEGASKEHANTATAETNPEIAGQSAAGPVIQQDAEAALYCSKAVVLADEKLACKIFLSAADPSEEKALQLRKLIKQKEQMF